MGRVWDVRIYVGCLYVFSTFFLCPACFFLPIDATTSLKNDPKKLPPSAAWEPGSRKHTVNFAKSSQSIGKYSEFGHVPKREIQESTVRVHKMKKMHFKKCMESMGPLTAAWPCFCVLLLYTSRAARGGGGSFKNRNRIGEIGCCESRMTKQKHWWIELSNGVTD